MAFSLPKGSACSGKSSFFKVLGEANRLDSDSATFNSFVTCDGRNLGGLLLLGAWLRFYGNIISVLLLYLRQVHPWHISCNISPYQINASHADSYSNPRFKLQRCQRRQCKRPNQRICTGTAGCIRPGRRGTSLLCRTQSSCLYGKREAPSLQQEAQGPASRR
jgi:hypothetical protein